MIKNIIFDFGDVFINLDKDATINAFGHLGLEKTTIEIMEIATAYEVGRISTDAFVQFFIDNFKFTKEDVVLAWNAILLDFPRHRLSFLKELNARDNYRLFLLSNTNELHISWIQKNWGPKMYAEFKSCFEKFYLSHEIHLRKPSQDIFEFVLQKNSLIAEETFFIDDTEEHTVTAKKLGIKTWNLIPGKEDVVDLLTKKEFRI